MLPRTSLQMSSDINSALTSNDAYKKFINAHIQKKNSKLQIIANTNHPTLKKILSIFKNFIKVIKYFLLLPFACVYYCSFKEKFNPYSRKLNNAIKAIINNTFFSDYLVASKNRVKPK